LFLCATAWDCLHKMRPSPGTVGYVISDIVARKGLRQACRLGRSCDSRLPVKNSVMPRATPGNRSDEEGCASFSRFRNRVQPATAMQAYRTVQSDFSPPVVASASRRTGCFAPSKWMKRLLARRLLATWIRFQRFSSFSWQLSIRERTGLGVFGRPSNSARFLRFRDPFTTRS
jgi:hypothetical protein